MKKTVIISGAIMAAVLGACNNETVSARDTVSGSAKGSDWRIAPRSDLNDFFECLESEGAAVVSAHRGGPAPGLPENAIETMRATLQSAPAFMEIDVASSSDGVLYLMHDDDLARTTTGGGPADGAPWSDISALRLRDPDGRPTDFSPPSFAETLAWADGRTILQIDFKYSARYEDAAAEIRRQNAEARVILIAYSVGSARKLHRLIPDAMISLNLSSESEVNAAVAAGIPVDRLLAFTGQTEPDDRFLQTLGRRDIEAVLGAIGGRASLDAEIARTGDDARYARFAAAGVDVIATDRPQEAFAALAAEGRAPEPGECGVDGPANAGSAS